MYGILYGEKNILIMNLCRIYNKILSILTQKVTRTDKALYFYKYVLIDVCVLFHTVCHKSGRFMFYMYCIWNT